MNTLIFALFHALNMAFLCLKEWFDPAYKGTPYEANSPIDTHIHEQKYYFVSKKLSIRI